MNAPATPKSPADYVLGVDDAELERLGFQHQLWADLAHRSWQAARIAPGQTVLDLGCGPGHATLDLAGLVRPQGKVLAVDQAAHYVEYLRARIEANRIGHIQTFCAPADKLDELDIEPGSVDLIYVRWMLCFANTPGRIIEQCASLLVPGGRLCVNDYFNYRSMTLAPRRAGFTRGIEAVAKSWIDQGGDSDIVGRLPGMAHASGLTVTHVEVDQRVARPGQTMWNWADSFWPNFIPRLVESGHLTQDQATEFMDDWHAASNDISSFMHLPPMYMLIAQRD